jgi:hypothetical protein
MAGAADLVTAALLSGMPEACGTTMVAGWMRLSGPAGTALVKTRPKRMQYRPALPEGFLTSTGLDLTPFCNPQD